MKKYFFAFSLLAALLALAASPVYYRALRFPSNSTDIDCSSANTDGLMWYNSQEKNYKTCQGSLTQTMYFALDSTSACVDEEFMGDQNTSGAIGTHGWNVQTIGSAPTISRVASVWPNLGILRVATTTTITQGGALQLISPSAVSPIGSIGSNAGWEMLWIFRINQTSNIRFRIGAFTPATAIAEPVDGIWLRFDTEATYADAGFKFVTRAASVNSTPVTTGVPTLNTNFHKFRLRSINAGTILFQADGNAEQAIATAVPTSVLSPGMIVVTNEVGVAKSSDVDKFGFCARNLAR